MTAAHLRAQITRVFLRLVCNVEDIRFKHRDRDFKDVCIFLDLRSVFGVVSGIHHEVFQIERKFRIPPEQLHQLCEQHAVLAAGNTHGNLISLAEQFILLDCADKGIPDRIAVGFGDTALDRLYSAHFSHIDTAPFTDHLLSFPAIIPYPAFQNKLHLRRFVTCDTL